MRKALFLLLFVAAGVAFAIALGNRAASASTLPVPLLGQEQSATNHNQTTQDAAAAATTRQANVNLPISVLSFGSNNGDVSQRNQANTDATAKNSNDTRQGIDQTQNAKADGSRGTSYGSRDGAISQDQSAANDNSTDQRSDASATTRQLNVNAPISVLSFDSNNGDVRQGNDGTTSATAKNDNGTAQKVDQNQSALVDGPHGSSWDKWAGWSNGDRGHADSIDQRQAGTNDNSTTQSADASALTKQKNFNAPISVLSFGFIGSGGDGCGCSKAGYSGNGVVQHNDTVTAANAGNDNRTGQKIDQAQNATVVPSKSEHRDGEYPHPPRHHKPEPCECEHHPEPVPEPCSHEHQPAPYPSRQEALIGRR